ncbi:hypothetical protein ACTJLD_03705 [Burkholderia sp. 22088]|uniref:hypothetical protein n=1 Tax=Burkholderia sp. 22088 TaxID=3453871 RepID=UPI003F851145
MLLLPASCRLVPPRSLSAQRKPRWPCGTAACRSRTTKSSPAAHCCVSLGIAERTAPAGRWFIRIVDADAAAQVRRAAEQNEIDRPAIGGKRVAAWGREHDNEKQARSVQKRVDKLKEDRTVATMSDDERR